MKAALRIAALLLALIAASGARAACTVPNTFVPNTLIQSSAINANFAAVVACANSFSSPFATSQAALASLPASLGNAIVTSATLPPATYNSTVTACTFNDGGSQIPITATGGGCWVLAPQQIYDIRWWGLSAPNQFYVSSSGNDYGGANFCVVAALPCATIKRAYTSLRQFNMQGLTATVTITAGTFGGVPITGAPPGGGPGTNPAGAAGGPSIVFTGAGATTIVTDQTSAGGVFLVDGGNNVTFSNMELSVPSGDDGIFVAGVGNFVVVSGITCFGQAGAANCLHVEGQSRVIGGPSQTSTLSGAFSTIYAITLGGQAQLNTNGIFACAVGLTISNSFVTLAKDSTGLFLGSLSGCAGIAATRNFTLTGDSFLDDASFTWPASMTGGVMMSGGRHAQIDTPCVGGAGGCANATAPTGFGNGATFAVAANSGLRSGQFQATTAGAPSGSGIVWLSFPSVLEVPGGALAQCIASPGQAAGGTAWGTTTTGPSIYVIAQNTTGGESIEIQWINGSSGAGLTAGVVYSINWSCNGD